MYRLIYSSREAQLFTPRQLEALLERSRANNAAKRITGMLIYNNGSFLQTLEGPFDSVSALYSRIKADPAHGGISLLYSETDFAARAFGEWSMGFYDCSGKAGRMAGHVHVDGMPRDLTRATALAIMNEYASVQISPSPKYRRTEYKFT